MRVIKFGGSSLADAPAVDQAVSVIQNTYRDDPSLCVVVSAAGGVTDEIIATARLASGKRIEYKDHLSKLRKRQMSMVSTIARGDRDVSDLVQELCLEFSSICDGVYALGELSAKVLDRLMSFGELCSAHLIAAACRQKGLDARFEDTRDLIVTDEHFGRARVDFGATNERMRRLDFMDAPIRIMPGFVARSANGRITTLGRNGSDYTAAIIGAALDAGVVEIWTDVDGVMTANPEYVANASPIEQMSYVEAMELSHFGAHVLHSPTIQPVKEKHIPLRVCNTFHPEFKGTLVGEQGEANRIITGISIIDDVSFIRVEGSGMVGVFGVAGRLFSAMAVHEVNLMMISQGSSEHSICFAIQSSDVQRAVLAIEKEFEPEMKAHMVDAPVVEKDMCVLAVVGENMRRQPGISGMVFGSLGSAGVNVVSIAQGSSERNISMVIYKADAVPAMNAIHEVFFTPNPD
ncbi:MAG: aspartate kinase [Deltaproteobacteria bacterium]|nr:aspartate kinase [Deltaproteobacteria bacterium]MBN2670716.1 aspartate kinase [Deltaproteobacteria bacterium]